MHCENQLAFPQLVGLQTATRELGALLIGQPGSPALNREFAYLTNGLQLMLIIFSGLPGVGKTAIGRELTHKLGAVYMRIDSIEQAIRNSGTVSQPFNDTGYRVAYPSRDACGFWPF